MFKNKNKLVSFPLMFIGLIMVFLGSRWLIHDEPWMLDKVANEERLDMTFETLFQSDINKTLPGYLKQIYRFFGLWVSIIGLFILSFSRYDFVKNKDIRIALLICIGVMVISGMILGYILIPKSPFIYLGWILFLLFLLPLYAHKKYE